MKISQFSGLLRQARHNVEMTFVVILSVIVAATWALSELVDEVVEGATSDIDRDILLMQLGVDLEADRERFSVSAGGVVTVGKNIQV